MSKLPFHSEETIKQSSFKTRLLEATGESLQASFTFWSKAKLKVIIEKKNLNSGGSSEDFVNRLSPEFNGFRKRGKNNMRGHQSDRTHDHT